ncbi:hypothetical protein TYRP_020427 [Tyrophagus putrescentiae]|nr:hypothetical protein TYRP_020427 [Tyrophagus putrescentiae]
MTEEKQKETFKEILGSLYEAFPEESNELNVYKNVARLERKTNNLLEFVSDPNKFKFEPMLKKALDLFVEMDTTENLVAQKDEVGESIDDLLLKIAEDMRKVKKANKEIIKKENHLKILNEFRAKDDCTSALREIQNAKKTITEEPSSSSSSSS